MIFIVFALQIMGQHRRKKLSQKGDYIIFPGIYLIMRGNADTVYSVFCIDNNISEEGEEK